MLAVVKGKWLPIALMIVLAMSIAVVIGGGELLVSEAAVSALLLASLGPTDHGLSPDRFLEALTGGAVGAIRESLDSLEVDADLMRANMRDDLYSERDSLGFDGEYLGAAEAFVDVVLEGS